MNVMNLKTGEPFDPAPRLHHREQSALAVSSSELSGRSRGMLLAAKSFYIGAKLPYDEEIQWIRSTGAQWINTGFIPPSQFSKAVWKFSTSWVGGSGNAWVASIRTQQYHYTPGQIDASTHRVTIGYYNSFANSTNVINSATKYDFEVEFTPTYQTLKIGGAKWIEMSVNATYSPNAEMTIFARNAYNGIVTNSSKVAMWNFSCEVDGVKALDLVPVKKDGKGAMFDRVSKRLRTNQGSGDFDVPSS